MLNFRNRASPVRAGFSRAGCSVWSCRWSKCTPSCFPKSYFGLTGVFTQVLQLASLQYPEMYSRYDPLAPGGVDL